MIIFFISGWAPLRGLYLGILGFHGLMLQLNLPHIIPLLLRQLTNPLLFIGSLLARSNLTIKLLLLLLFELVQEISMFLKKCVRLCKRKKLLAK